MGGALKWRGSLSHENGGQKRERGNIQQGQGGGPPEGKGELDDHQGDRFPSVVHEDCGGGIFHDQITAFVGSEADPWDG